MKYLKVFNKKVAIVLLTLAFVEGAIGPLLAISFETQHTRDGGLFSHSLQSRMSASLDPLTADAFEKQGNIYTRNRCANPSTKLLLLNESSNLSTVPNCSKTASYYTTAVTYPYMYYSSALLEDNSNVLH